MKRSLDFYVLFSLFTTVFCQDCLRANNPDGPPPFMDYRNSDLRSATIPELHQVIVPSYRFTCCGNITEWGVDVNPAGGGHDGVYTLHLQVWRPSLNVEATGCYSLVGNNMFTSVPLANQVAMVTPLPEDRIQFQPGDVLGFMLENTDGNDGGVVLLIDSGERNDSGYETEEVWHADTNNAVINNLECPYPVGTQTGRTLNTLTSAAPVISVSYRSTVCPPNIMPTNTPATSPQQPATEPGNRETDTAPLTDNIPPRTPSINSGSGGPNAGLIAGIVITVLLISIIITLAVVLLVCIMKRRCAKERGLINPNYDLDMVSVDENAAYGVSNLYEDGDHIDNNVAYGVSDHIDHALVDSNEAYGISEVGDLKDNEAYGVTLQKTDTLQEFVDNTPHTYDYPLKDLNHLETKPNETYATVVLQQ